MNGIGILILEQHINYATKTRFNAPLGTFALLTLQDHCQYITTANTRKTWPYMKNAANMRVHQIHE